MLLRSRARRCSFAACAVSFLVSGACFAQEPPRVPPSSSRVDLATRLKRAADVALARMVRDLRSELHRIIDESVGGGNATDLDTLLAEIERSAAAPEGRDGTAPAAPGPGVADLSARLRGLRKRLGPDDPDLLRLETDLEALRSDTDADPRTARLAGLLGCALARVSEEFEVLHRLAPDEARRIIEVAPGGPAESAGILSGDVVVGLEGPFPDPPSWRVTVISGVSGTTRTVFFRAENVTASLPGRRPLLATDLDSDPKSLIDSALRKALREVVPPYGGMILPEGEKPRNK